MPNEELKKSLTKTGEKELNRTEEGKRRDKKE